MKELKNYILESIEIVPNKHGDSYRTIILVKRTNVDCANLTKDEFISMFTEDFRTAIKESNTLLDKEHEDSKEVRVEKVRREAEKYVSTHYKRESNKKKYIDNAVANELSKDRYHWSDIKRFDFDISFGRSNSRPSYCTISEDTLKTLGKIYDDLTNEKEYANTFWKEATGWEFKYTTDKNSFHSAFRPWVDLIVSDTKKEEIKKNEEHLSDAIHRFYANTNYWGD